MILAWVWALKHKLKLTYASVMLSSNEVKRSRNDVALLLKGRDEVPSRHELSNRCYINVGHRLRRWANINLTLGYKWHILWHL